MMSVAEKHLQDYHFNVRGVLAADAPLGAQSWFRCGGSADLLFEPADHDDLCDFLTQARTQEGVQVPFMIIGGMANTIVRDGGVRGIVIRLGKAFADISFEGGAIVAGAGALNGSVAAYSAKNGYGDLEFLSGIPGSVGGAVAMNAGAYGREVSDSLIDVQGVFFDGRVACYSAEQLHMAYRHTDLPDGFIVTSARFKAREEDSALVKARLKAIKEKRRDTQPISEKTGGSTFANPSEDLRAWQVVERVGGRELQIGGARMSDKHCNFMINDGSACAADLEALGDELIARAKDQLDVDLRWEIKRIGVS